MAEKSIEVHLLEVALTRKAHLKGQLRAYKWLAGLVHLIEHVEDALADEFGLGLADGLALQLASGR